MEHPFAIEPPIAVVSDLHLGHPASYLTDPSCLLGLVGRARTLLVNGDTCEMLNVARRARARELLARLVERLASEGIRAIFVTGNHDPDLSSAHHVDLFAGRVFITHGDVLHPAIAPWAREVPGIRAERARLLAGDDEPEALDDRLLLAKRCALVASRYDHGYPSGLLARLAWLSRFATKPVRIGIAMHYWSHVPALAGAFQRRYRPGAQLVLLGHTHRPGVRTVGGCTLVNTGSFQPLSRALVVYLCDGEAEVHQMRRRRGGYRLAGVACRIGVGGRP